MAPTVPGNAFAAALQYGDAGTKAHVLMRMQQTVGNVAAAHAAASALVVTRQKQGHAHTHHGDDPTLDWGEFKGKVPKNAKFDAETFAGIETNIDAPQFEYEETDEPAKAKGKKKWKARVVWDPDARDSVRAYMDPKKSWVRPGKQSDTLLGHEQGHFDIANAISERTEAALESAMTDAGVGEWVTADSKTAAKNAAIGTWNNALKKAMPIAKAGLAKLSAIQHDYDEDPAKGTGHGLKATEQKAWGEEITKGLPDYDLAP